MSQRAAGLLLVSLLSAPPSLVAHVPSCTMQCLGCMQVLHVPDLDFNTTCYTFKSCLFGIKRWSGGIGGLMLALPASL